MEKHHGRQVKNFRKEGVADCAQGCWDAPELRDKVPEASVTHDE